MSDRALHLIARHLEGTLTESEHAEFNDLLRIDPAARTALIQATLHARLLNTRLNTDNESDKPHADAEPTPGEASGTPPRPLSAAGAPIYRAGHEPKPDRIRPVYYAVTAIAAALLVVCGLGVYLLTTSIDPQPEIDEPKPDGPPIATLIQSTGTVIANNNIANEGTEYAAGTYSIESGSAQFFLRSRVTVDLKGKTRLRMHNPMVASLTRGAASFNCPPGAEGFTVHLPDGSKVVDLGTKFNVEVDDQGVSIVTVNVGEVQVETTNGSIGLIAGHRAVVHNGERLVINPILFNAATNDPDRGDAPPGLAMAFDHSDFAIAPIRVEHAFGAVRDDKTIGQVLMRDGGVADNGNDILGDGGETIDHIAWTLREPVSIAGYRVGLRPDKGHDGRPRSAQLLRLIIDDTVVDTYDADGLNGDLLRVLADGPITGQRFRLEFTRTTDGKGDAGPRIVNIDAVKLMNPTKPRDVTASPNPDRSKESTETDPKGTKR